MHFDLVSFLNAGMFSFSEFLLFFLGTGLCRVGISFWRSRQGGLKFSVAEDPCLLNSHFHSLRAPLDWRTGKGFLKDSDS